VFGTQRDVFRAWCFWRKEPMETNTGSTEMGASIAEQVIVPPDGLSSLTDIDIEGMHESDSVPVYTHPPYARHYTTKKVHVVVTSQRIEA
jgi:hypothetical protein